MPALPSRPSTTIARRCAASCTDRTLHRFCQAFTPSAQQIEGSHSRPLPRGSALRLQLSPGGGLVCYRRILSVPARSGGGRLTERIPAIPPRLRERVKVPLSRHSAQHAKPSPLERASFPEWPLSGVIFSYSAGVLIGLMVWHH